MSPGFVNGEAYIRTDREDLASESGRLKDT